MPNPTYAKVPVWDGQNWVTELPQTFKDEAGNAVSGKLVIAEIDPDDIFMHRYQEEVLNDDGSVTLVDKTKTNFKETQTFFIPNGQNIEDYLATATKHHYKQLQEKFNPEANPIPAPPDMVVVEVNPN